MNDDVAFLITKRDQVEDWGGRANPTIPVYIALDRDEAQTFIDAQNEKDGPWLKWAFREITVLPQTR